jgi:hypothetical protein
MVDTPERDDYEPDDYLEMLELIDMEDIDFGSVDEGTRSAGPGQPPVDEKEKAPLEKLFDLILLNADSKGAAWIDIEVGPHPDSGEETTLVHYCIGGRKELEMTPPRKLHERLMDRFADMTDVEENFRGCRTFRGNNALCTKDTILFGFRLTVVRPEDSPSTAFVELHEPRAHDREEEGEKDGNLVEH